MSDCSVYPCDAKGISVSGDTATLNEEGVYEIIYNLSYKGFRPESTSVVLVLNGEQIEASKRYAANSQTAVGANYLFAAKDGDALQVLLSNNGGISDIYLNFIIKKYRFN